MSRQTVLLCLLVALVLVAAPAVVALHALLLGDIEFAWRVFGPVLLIPVGLLVYGVARSFRRRPGDVDKQREPD